MSTVATRSASARRPLAEMQQVQTPKATVRAHKRVPDAPRKKPAFSGHKAQKKHKNDLNERDERWREVAEFESRLVAVADDPLPEAEEVPPPSDDEVYSDPEWEADDAPPVVLRLKGVESRKRSAAAPPCPRPRRGRDRV